MDHIVARHLTADLYGCKINRFPNEEALKTQTLSLLEANGFHILAAALQTVDEEHTALLLLLGEGHFAIHLYKPLGYAAADLFLCKKDAAPDRLLQSLRAIFKPEKFRTTSLKRGDFNVSGGADMKPSIKTRVAPLRRIHNTGAKVIRLLAHRKR